MCILGVGESATGEKEMRTVSVWMGIVLYTAICLATAFASDTPAPPPAAPQLSTYLGLQRNVVPGARVVSGFHDHRSASRYRKHAGQHNGYDVEMPRGSTVVAGWSGEVVRIIPWYGQEKGIAIRSPDGFVATYGHLKPCVAVGMELRPGDAVGITLIDHVDIKMRSPNGHYYDFGAAAVALTDTAPNHGPDRAERFRRYVNERYSIDLTHDQASRVLDAERAAQEAVRNNRKAVQRVRHWWLASRRKRPRYVRR